MAYAQHQMDAEARQRLLEEQLPQVRFIARRIHDRLPAHVALEDLVHAGILGLMDAIEKFDPGKHVQLQSYAKFRIRGAILDSLRELDWSPRDLRKKARRLEQVERDCRSQLGRAPTETELALGMGMELQEFQTFLGDLRGLDLGSLQGGVDETGGSEWSEVEVRDPGPDPFQIFAHGEARQKLLQALDELPARERQVLALYYYEELTMKEIGAVLGIGESRVSQVHSVALVRLRSRITELTSAPEPMVSGRRARA
jgi:RNA polymerase sigma factor for flagellar operon FliA